jgi:hypothetical protein
LVVEPYPSEKTWSESQLGWLFHTQLMMGKSFKIHPNHQPGSIYYPLVNVQKTMENHHFFYGKIHYFLCTMFNSYNLT